MVKSKITLNVLENISNIVSNKGFSGNGRKALVLFNGSYLEEHLRVEKILELKDKGLDIALGFSFMAERIIDTRKIIDILRPIEVYREEDIMDFPKIVKNYDLIIGPNITMNTLSKVSLGMIDSFIPNVIWTFLYQGKKVYLDYHSATNFLGEPTKSVEIQNVIQNHIRSLNKMGAIEIQENNYLDKIILSSDRASSEKINTDRRSTEIHKKTNNPSVNNQDYISNNLITEKDMVIIAETKKSIVLEKNTVITPLAKDKARELGVKIERK